MLSEPLGAGSDGAPVFLRDIWPSNREIDEAIADTLSPDLFRARYEQVFEGGPAWQAIGAAAGTTFAWDESSTYLRPPPYFDGVGPEPETLTDIRGARPLAILGDTVTTDHISLIATIAPDGPAGQYLRSIGVEPKDFNSFVGRRGNHEVCMRGTFANARLRNEMVPGVEGGFTRHAPSGEQMTIFDAAMRYKADGVPLVVIAGKEYGAGVIARLGGQGHATLWRPRGHRRGLRAHPPRQPRVHGRVAPRIHRQRHAPHARLRRQRNARHYGHHGCAHAAHGGRLRDHARERGEHRDSAARPARPRSSTCTISATAVSSPMPCAPCSSVPRDAVSPCYCGGIV